MRGRDKTRVLVVEDEGTGSVQLFSNSLIINKQPPAKAGGFG